MIKVQAKKAVTILGVSKSVLTTHNDGSFTYTFTDEQHNSVDEAIAHLSLGAHNHGMAIDIIEAGPSEEGTFSTVKFTFETKPDMEAKKAAEETAEATEPQTPTDESEEPTAEEVTAWLNEPLRQDVANNFTTEVPPAEPKTKKSKAAKAEKQPKVKSDQAIYSMSTKKNIRARVRSMIDAAQGKANEAIKATFKTENDSLLIQVTCTEPGKFVFTVGDDMVLNDQYQCYTAIAKALNIEA